MTKLTQLIISGVAAGAIYGALAVSICLIFRVSGVLHTSVGAFAVLPAIAAEWLQDRHSVPRGLAILGTASLMGCGAYAIDRLITGPALRRGATLAEALFVMFGIGVTLEGIALVGFGREPYSAQPQWSGRPFRILGAIVQRQQVVLVVAALVLAIGLAMFFRVSLTGKAMTACLDSVRGADIVGIPVDRLRRISFVTGAVLAAFVGHLVMPMISFSYNTGFILTLPGLLAASMAGLVDPVKGLLAGLTVGVLEAVIAGYVTSTFQSTFVFITLTAVLLARPGLVAGRRA